MKVRLENVPTRVFLDHVQHLDTLLQELRIVASGQQSGAVPVVAGIADFIDALLARYVRARDENYVAARAALDRGAEHITLEADLPEEAAADAERLLEALERADEICREQGLLTLPASPAVAEFRRWAIPEVARQLRAGNER